MGNIFMCFYVNEWRLHRNLNGIMEENEISGNKEFYYKLARKLNKNRREMWKLK